MTARTAPPPATRQAAPAAPTAPVPPAERAPRTRAAPRTAAAPPERSRRERIARELRRRPLYALAAALLASIVAIAIVAPWLPLPEHSAPVLADRQLAPLSRGQDGTLHLLGTDQLGRDVLARTLVGARITVGIAIGVVLIGSIVGSTLGLVAGYVRGFPDQIVMRLADLQLAFPYLLLAILVLYVLGPGIRQLIGLLAVLSWVQFARMARALTLSLREEPYVEAAVALGASTPRLLVKHVLPQMLPVLAMIAVLDFGTIMLVEAGLSFLGFGVQPPDASWGAMVADGRQFVNAGAWWLFLTPGLAIFLAVFAANLTSRWAQELLGATHRH